MKILTEQEVRQTIRREIESSSLRQVADRFGIDPGNLSKQLNGERPISDIVALAFGFEREVIFRKRAA